MWYPEILNKMSGYIEKYPEKDVMLCSAINESTKSENFNTTTAGEVHI